MSDPASEGAPRGEGARVLALCLWGAGVQVNEAVASAGVLLTVGLALADARPWRIPARLWIEPWSPLWAYAAWALFAPMAAGRLPTGTGLARLSDWVALPAAVMLLVRVSPRGYRRFGVVCAAAFLLTCIAAGLQSYGLWPGVHGDGPPWLRTTMSRVYEEASDGRFMGGGLLFHRLKFAHVGGLAVLAAFALARRGLGRGRAIGWGVAALGFYAVAAFPFARGALAALAASMGVVALFTAEHRLRTGVAVALALLSLGTAVWLSPPLRARFESSFTSEGNGNRAALWRSGALAVAAHPWVGLGLGRFKPADFAAEGERVHEASRTVKAHAQLLTLAAESGVPGATLFVVWLLWACGRFSTRRPEGAAALGCVVFFVLLSIAHDPLFHAPFSMALVLLLAAGFAKGRSEPAR